MSKAVEAAAEAMSPRKDHAPQYEYTARKMLQAALPALTEGLDELIDKLLDGDCGYGVGEHLAAAISKELKARIEA